MQADIEGFEPIHQVRSLAFDTMAVDYWSVRAHSKARGNYMSRHPRFVVFLKDAGILVSQGGRPWSQHCACCYIPPGVHVRSSPRRPGNLAHVDIHLPLARLEAIVDRGTPLDAPLLLADPGPLSAIADALADECMRPRRSASHVETLARAMILEMFHHGRSPIGRAVPLDEGLRAYVMDNLDRRISVDRLASIAGMSRTNLTRAFRQRTGQSPYQWVMGLKIDRAKTMMQTGVPFAQVASATGFSDQAHFNRAFKSSTGCAPGVWMKEH